MEEICATLGALTQPDSPVGQPRQDPLEQLILTAKASTIFLIFSSDSISNVGIE
jgi:hypothetical protein